MARIDSTQCTCRNCGHTQTYNIVDGQLPDLDRSIATCRECGFKSVWYYQKLELSVETIENFGTLIENYKNFKEKNGG